MQQQSIVKLSNGFNANLLLGTLTFHITNGEQEWYNMRMKSTE
jgi:hypothetical protein